MLKLWIRTFGREFYKQHAGLLLIMFYLLFGWMKSGEILGYLRSILLEFCATPVAISGFCFFLLLYGVKSLTFINQKLSTNVYSFVKVSCGEKKRNQFKSWLGLYSILLFPPLFFALLVCVTGLYYQYYWSVFSITVYVILLLWGLSRYTFRQVNYTFKPAKHIFIPWPTVKKPFWTWSIHYVLKKQPLMLIICKVVSFMVFSGIIWIFADSINDIRVYLIALLGATISHSVLLATVLRFERSSLSFLNSLPLSNWNRLLNTLLFVIILFVPEFILFGTKAPLSIYTAGTVFLYSVASLITLKMSLYFLKDNMDKYLKFIFFFFLVSMLSILNNQFLILIVVLLICNSIYHRYLFYKNKL